MKSVFRIAYSNQKESVTGFFVTYVIEFFKFPYVSNIEFLPCQIFQFISLFFVLFSVLPPEIFLGYNKEIFFTNTQLLSVYQNKQDHFFLKYKKSSFNVKASFLIQSVFYKYYYNITIITVRSFSG